MSFRFIFRVCVWLFLVTTAVDTFARNCVLVPAGDRWRYLANGTDPGAGWLDPAFRALEWPLAVAEIGYGDGSQVTAIAPPPASAAQTTTVYFHKVFSCPNPKRYTLLQLRVRRDDAAGKFSNSNYEWLSHFLRIAVEYLDILSHEFDRDDASLPGFFGLA